MNYKEYIKSEEWYQLKIDLLNKRGCKCEKCGKKKRPTSLHIHHITYERLFNEKPEDLMILCPICHMKEHGLIKEKKKQPKPKKKIKRLTMDRVVKKYKRNGFKNLSSLVKAIKSAKQ